MKPNRSCAVLFCTVSAAVLIASGCAASGGGTTADQGTRPLFPIQQSDLQQSPAPQSPTQPSQQVPAAPAPQTPADGIISQYLGTWVHTYEYFDTTYRTTLVIDQNGTAVYYNEEAELGNFSATWQQNGSSLYVVRSDGTSSTLTLNGTTLIETSYEDGYTYQAEYTRAAPA